MIKINPFTNITNGSKLCLLYATFSFLQNSNETSNYMYEEKIKHNVTITTINY